MAETALERYQRGVRETYVPTWEEYSGSHPEATYKQYLEAYSAIAAQKQVWAGEIPENYGEAYSFTPMGYWAPAGSPATIGGLPSEIKDIFPGVQSTFETALQTGYEQSVIGQQEKPSEADVSVNTESVAGEPQTSFQALPQTMTPETNVGIVSGGVAALQFNDPGAVGQTGVGGIGALAGLSQGTFAGNGNGNGNGGNGGESGGLGLLALLAIALGAGL